MLRTLRRLLLHTEARLLAWLDRFADPRVQVDQAVEEAYRRHTLLRQQAAVVIAAEHGLRERLARAGEEARHLEAAIGVALAGEKEQVAIRLAGRLALSETSARSLAELLPAAEAAAEKARATVDRSRLALLQTGEERLRLLGRLEAAKLLERSTAISDPSLEGHSDVPRLDEVRDKIDQRWAIAAGNAELADSETDAQLLDLEHSVIEAAGRRRLAEIRDRLRLSD
jgi:phage shock protein A